MSFTGNFLSFKRHIPTCMLLLTMVLVGIYLLRPLYDPDFYWHLKTGQWIWQHKALPHTDLFGIPPFPESSPRTEFIYTSYWLLQLILYGFYSLFGMSGIIVFRWIIACVSLLTAMYWTDVRDSNVSAVIAIGSVQLLELYFIERPQFVSFVCFGILLVLLLRAIGQGNRSLWGTLVPLSVLMMVWANMHGGFLIGQAILIFCVAAEGIKFCHSSLSPLSAGNYRILVISAASALLASFINPNAVNLIKYLPLIFDSNYYVNVNNLEEFSLLRYFQETRDSTMLLYGASIALTAVALLTSRYRKNITWVGILAGTAFMGCLHMRLMPFFLVSATILMTRYFERECTSVKGRVLLFSMLAITLFYSVGDEFSRIHESTRTGWVPIHQFPVRSSDFIVSNAISGNIYTTMLWGGYMIWRAGPVDKIFYDGRTLNVQRAWEYDNSRIVSPNQRPYWKGLFAAYDIRVAVLPLYEDDGRPNLLTQSIRSDKEWTMVFAAENEVVLLKSR
ncbi:MAG: hypothetical protein PHI31_16645 [Desulfuromonadaceae bacterium]|nr:hypothetical protein [Desulfuromonadaceae bacterium]